MCWEDRRVTVVGVVETEKVEMVVVGAVAVGAAVAGAGAAVVALVEQKVKTPALLMLFLLIGNQSDFRTKGEPKKTDKNALASPYS